MKMFFTPYVRIVFYFCALIFIVYSFSDFFQGVPDSTFFSAVITLLVIGTIVARHLDRKKSLKIYFTDLSFHSGHSRVAFII